MKNLTLTQRLCAVGGLVMLTVSIALFYFVSKGFSQDIAIAKLEQEGIRYQEPLAVLLERISEHQFLARTALAGHAELNGQVADSEKRVDAALVALQGVDKELGGDLQFTREGLVQRRREHATHENLQREWVALKNSLAGKKPGESDEAHSHLLADVSMMIAHAADTSNLTLDSELDSYYLMDAIVVALPAALDHLSTIQMMAQDLPADPGALDEGNRLRLAGLQALAKEADLERISGDLQTTLNEDQNYHGLSVTLQQRVLPASLEYRKANQAVIEFTRQVLEKTEGVQGAAGAELANRARESGFRLWQTGSKELMVLLQIRIDELASNRMWALLLITLALTGCSLLAFFVLRNVTGFLRASTHELHDHSEAITLASRQIAAAAHELANGATEQAASLEETAGSSLRINAVAKRNSESSHAAAELVTRSRNTFAAANRALDDMVKAIDQIHAESGKISRIIKVIDEIAFQTNILALNAAVEAARAGESGMGFGVVADEVRNLAQRCAQAARDTAELIEGSISLSNDGKTKVDQVAAAIRAVTNEAAKIKELVDDVNLSSQEQTSGIDQVVRAITQIEQVTQRNAATAEESASSVAELNAQSEILKGIVDQLTVVVGGATLAKA